LRPGRKHRPVKVCNHFLVHLTAVGIVSIEMQEQGLMLWKFATPGGTAFIPTEFVIGQATIAVGAILAVSIGLYAMVERPGRALLRGFFGLSKPRRQQLDAAL
jgi:hypothetical protein